VGAYAAAGGANDPNASLGGHEDYGMEVEEL
jgi:hypothetical protein